jgi:hypothetical protein
VLSCIFLSFLYLLLDLSTSDCCDNLVCIVHLMN